MSELVAPLNFTPLPVDPKDVYIPCTADADTADHHLNLIIQVLQSALHPGTIIESEWYHLISYALQFFIYAKNLWCKNAHGQHKIVIPPGHHLKLLSQAHDEVGHHGTYATCTHLRTFLVATHEHGHQMVHRLLPYLSDQTSPSH